MTTKERIARNRAMEARIAAREELTRAEREAKHAKKVRKLMREFILSLPTRSLQLEALAIYVRTEVHYGR